MKENSVYIHIRVPKEIKEKITKEAQKKGLSLNGYVLTTLLDVIDLESEELFKR